MKKLSFIAVAVLTSLTVFAQTSPTFGLKAGLNISNLKIDLAPGNEEPDHGTTLGLHVGVLAHIHISKNIGIQPELVYSSQGMEQTIADKTFDWKLNYLNVPIMVQYMFDNGFRIEAGPQIGLLLNAKLQDNTGSSSMTKSFKSADVGLGFGLSYLTYSGFGIGGRYNLGVGNIAKDESSTSNKLYNRVGQISIFYMLKSNHKAASAK